MGVLNTVLRLVCSFSVEHAKLWPLHETVQVITSVNFEIHSKRVFEITFAFLGIHVWQGCNTTQGEKLFSFVWALWQLCAQVCAGVFVGRLPTNARNTIICKAI